jgi:transposase
MSDAFTDWKTRAEAAEARVAALEKQVAELMARLNQNSSNSHKPPSLDGPKARKKRRSKRKSPSGRKAGGQPGHKGAHRALLPEEDVDHVVEVRAETCSCCGMSLAGQPGHGKPMRHQQVELPPIQPIVTELRAQAVRCSCGEVNAAPIRRDQTWCTGPRLMSVVATLAGRYRLSRDETTSLLDLLGVTLSEGTVQAVCERVSSAVAMPVYELEQAIPTASQLFLDETGWRQGKERHWLWTASCAAFTVFAIHRRRSSAQVRAWLPEGVHSIVTSDRWSAYGHLDIHRRQLCWAHLHRDLQGLVDGAPDDEELAGLLAGMKQMFRAWRDFKSGELDRGELQARVAPYRKALRAWAFREADAAAKGKRRGLARGLKKAWPAVFQFIDVDGVEPTNNQAERALRPAVLWRKGSFGTRSDAGSRFVERILSVWATCRQQGRSLIDWVSDAVTAHTHQRAGPTLLPA